jgi:hypothetical protein
MKAVSWLCSKNYSVNELLHEGYRLLGYGLYYQTAQSHTAEVIATMRRKCTEIKQAIQR